MSLSSILEKGFLDDIKERALVVIKKEREQFNPVWETIKKYCEKNKLIISNKYVILGKENIAENIHKKEYNIYTSKPFKHANNLANEIHKNNNEDPDCIYMRMRTITENETFAVDYNLRQVAIIHKIQSRQRGEPTQLIKPVSINKLLYMPSEIELIDIYHTLYDPSRYDETEEAMMFEKLLFKRVAERKEKGIIGGSICKDLKKQRIEALKIGIVSEWMPNKSNLILIGPWAYDWIRTPKELCANIEKIQIISDWTAEEMKVQLQRYVHTITKFTITYREQELDIPKDARTKRYTFYIQCNTDRGIVEKPFMDLFPIAVFEIIPYNKIEGVLIGDRNVILRFLFIDMWVIRVIQSLGILSKDILNKKITYLWELIDFFRMRDGQKCVDFIGTHRDAIIDKKMTNLKGNSHYPYYPSMFYNKQKSYRVIN
jgi:hypothetical protein